MRRSLGYALCVLVPALASSERVRAESGLDVSLFDRVTYDDNLFRLSGADTRTGANLPPGSGVDDILNEAGIGIAATLQHGRQKLELNAEVSDNRYADSDSLNHTGINGSAHWDWRLGTPLAGRIGADYRRAQAGFADAGFLGPDMLDTEGYFASLRIAAGPRFRIEAGARGDRITHSAEPRQDDNYELVSGNLGLGYETQTGNLIGVEARRTSAKFPRAALIGGVPFDRDYDEDEAMVRVLYALAGKLRLDARGGHLDRDYSNRAVTDLSAFVWRGALNWSPSVKTGIEVGAWREVTASPDTAADAYAGRGVSLRPSWSPTAWLTLRLQASLEDQHYIRADPAGTGPRRKDELRMLELSLLYSLRESFSASLTGRDQHRNSNVAQRSYDARQLVLDLRYTW